MKREALSFQNMAETVEYERNVNVGYTGNVQKKRERCNSVIEQYSHYNIK